MFFCNTERRGCIKSTTNHGILSTLMCQRNPPVPASYGMELHTFLYSYIIY